ncbi:hypothetical protein [Cellulomonas endometrii]|uniref:hypothetical protein n=1 Tax=Cellulomonas endometrii TaxID=3036301 RepID=UPI0024ADC3DA|nr:hypothetical protein [Cellulomonas endometrii]
MAEVAVRASAGTVTTTTAGARVVVLDDGSRVTPLWPATVLVDGDKVQVLLVDGTAHVIGPVVAAPRPVSGTIAGAASSGLIPVTTTTGAVQARYAGTAPAIGTLVGLIWQGGAPPLLLPGALAPIATDPRPAPEVPVAPPSAPDTGTLLVSAVGSGSWRTGSWGWADTADVVQGGAPFAAQDSRGGWWYGDQARSLAGRTITRLRFRVPARTRIGMFADTLPAHFYRTGDVVRPGADFTRVTGPHDVTVPPGWNPPADQGWVDLPAAWGQAIADTGGGIGTAGSPYLGLLGVGADPASGQLLFDWTR